MISDKVDPQVRNARCEASMPFPRLRSSQVRAAHASGRTSAPGVGTTGRTNDAFDVVVVGAGPSSLGLLHGLLLLVLRSFAEGDDDDGEEKRSEERTAAETGVRAEEGPPPLPPSFRIAIVERGERGANDGGECGDPRNWFGVSHDPPSFCCRRDDGDEDRRRRHRRVRDLYETVPQLRLGNRILSVPVGRGLGGGTVVNACLFARPSADDFDCWPGVWRGGRSIADGAERLEAFAGRHGGWEGRDADDGYLRCCAGRGTSGDGEAGGATSTAAAAEDDPQGTHLHLPPPSRDHRTRFPSFVTRVPTATATASPHDGNGGGERKGKAAQVRRVGFYESLVEPLFASWPELRERVTFFTGVEVQRVLLSPVDGDGSDGTGGNRTKWRATGVECLPASSSSVDDDAGTPVQPDPFFRLTAKREVVLCCGAVLSPALLLASGVGPLETLRDAGVKPYWENSPVVARRGEWGGDAKGALPASAVVPRRCHEGVGRNLRDHVLIPRAFLTPYRRNGTIRSVSGVRALLNLDVDVPPPSRRPDVDGRASARSRRRRRFQFQFTDGTGYDRLIPHFLASVFRRGFDEHDGGDKTSVRTLNAASAALFRTLRAALAWAFAREPLRFLSRNFFATVNICLLDPASTGTVTVRRRGERRARSGGSGRSPSDSNGSPSDSNGRPPPRPGEEGDDDVGVVRLKDLEVRIDPGYLSDPSDRHALAVGWERAGNAVRERWFGGCREVLPGVLYRRVVPWAARSFGWIWNAVGGATAVRGAAGKTNGNGDAPDWLDRYARDFACPYFHWCGTCAMGEEEAEEEDENCRIAKPNEAKNDAGGRNDFVVNDRLQVRGVAKLRVCDASVFPSCVSGPTALTCAGMGFVASGILAEDWASRW